MALVDTLLMLGLVAVLILLNAFFVAAEFAFVKVRSSQLTERVERGERAAKAGQHVIDHLDRYLSSAQLGITLTSLGLGWVGEPAVAKLIEGPLLAAGFASPVVLHALAFAIAFSIITFLHITIGEQVPKSAAIQKSMTTTLWSARPMIIFHKIFAPFIWVINASSNAMLKLMGIQPAGEGDVIGSEEELRILLAQAGAKRVLAKHRADFILRFFELKDLEARHVMTPRMRIVPLDAQRDFDANLGLAEEAGYSRFPVIDGNLEHVLGMVHYRDLVAMSRRPKRDLRAITRPVLFVPESQSAEDTLDAMLKRGLHMAVVTDEFGSTAGIVTLEDIFEELFGEIRDEFDTHEVDQMYKDLGEGHFVLDGLTPLHRASAILQEPLDNADVTTLSGYIVAELGRLPQKGERIRIGEYEGIVRDVDRKRIQTLELWRAESEETEAEA